MSGLAYAAPPAVPHGGPSHRFDYILQRILNAQFQSDPFKHVYIADFFSRDDFSLITTAPEVNIRPVESDRALISELYSKSYKEIEFPGTTTNVPSYLEWHNDPARDSSFTLGLCEGYGVTMRLQRTTPGTILREAQDFFRAPAFWAAVAAKFGIDIDDVTIDFGLQKYLDGYEISPHPDIRKKALTLMVNINPAAHSEAIDYHTHYLRFRPERAKVQEYWRSNKDAERCWVPWSWCETARRQTRNNSIVIFSPADDTLHAVRASYDHLSTQRTQFYGNLWYKNYTPLVDVKWRNFDFDADGNVSVSPNRHRAGDELSFTCRRDTFLKASEAHSSKLRANEKLAFVAGDKVSGTLSAETGEYFVLTSVNARGSAVDGENWHLMKTHWRML